jgi:signal transduction histidine kinase
MTWRTLGSAVSRHRELTLATAFVGMAGWELTEFLVLESAHVPHGRLTLGLHSVQVLLVVAVTWVVIRAWQERTRHEVVVAQEEERRRIAHEVHDGIAQLIVSAKQHVDTARDVATDDPDRSARETARAAERLERAIVETRQVLQALRPSAVDQPGDRAAPAVEPGHRQEVRAAHPREARRVGSHPGGGGRRAPRPLRVKGP